MLDRLQKSKLNISVTIIAPSADVPRTYEESRRCYKISSRQDNENVLEIVSCWFSRKNESKL